MKVQEYSFWKSFLKMVVKVGVLAIPLVIGLLPKEWMDLTLGGALYMLLDWMQKKFTTV